MGKGKKEQREEKVGLGKTEKRKAGKEVWKMTIQMI